MTAPIASGAQTQVIAVFARAPIAGQVKTRMQPALSGEQCAELHRALTTQVLKNVSEVCDTRVQLWCDGDSPFFSQLADDYGCELKRQCEGDLGARMADVTDRSLAHFDTLVMVGADCPFVTAPRLQALFRALVSGADAAMIPALDGGYAALALRRNAPQLFENKRWGGDDVAAATIADFAALGWSYQLASPVADIDRVEDLRLLSELPELARFAAWAD